MSFYQVTLRGRYASQAIINVLWYRETAVIPTLAEFLTYSEAIAEEVFDNIWRTPGIAPFSGVGLRAIMQPGYMLEAIEVMIHNEIGTPLSTTPYIRTVGEIGVRNESTNGPQTVVILNANLEPAFGPGIGLPKRGHVKMGPLADVDVDNGGLLTPASMEDWTEFGVHLGSNLVTESPVGNFFPVRVRVTRVDGIITALTYRDVIDFVPNPQAKWLKSRRPEL